MVHDTSQFKNPFARNRSRLRGLVRGNALTVETGGFAALVGFLTFLVTKVFSEGTSLRRQQTEEIDRLQKRVEHLEEKIGSIEARSEARITELEADLRHKEEELQAIKSDLNSQLIINNGLLRENEAMAKQIDQLKALDRRGTGKEA